VGLAACTNVLAIDFVVVPFLTIRTSFSFFSSKKAIDVPISEIKDPNKWSIRYWIQGRNTSVCVLERIGSSHTTEEVSFFTTNTQDCFAMRR
jgi:hypothetical protein